RRAGLDRLPNERYGGGGERQHAPDGTAVEGVRHSPRDAADEQHRPTDQQRREQPDALRAAVRLEEPPTQRSKDEDVQPREPALDLERETTDADRDRRP